MFCTKCGNSLPDSAVFCTVCGARVGSLPAERQPAPTQPVPQVPAPQQFLFSAPGFTGEAVLGSLGGDAAGTRSGLIPGPGKVMGNGARSFFSSLGSLFKEPKRLIPVALLAAVWLTLDILKACGINPIPTRILSFLTFANGGMSGGFLGAVGGILGKGIFAGAVASLIGLFTRKSGGKRSFGETLKGAFGVSLDTLWAYLCGIGGAMLLYLFISGGATRISFMGGIAAAFLAARAAVSGGFLGRLLASFTKGKTVSNPQVQGILRGLSVGFGAAALIGLANINLILIITGSVLLAGGAVMMILQATGAVKLGKGAQAQ